jgi:hypothetical protein
LQLAPFFSSKKYLVYEYSGPIPVFEIPEGIQYLFLTHSKLKDFYEGDSNLFFNKFSRFISLGYIGLILFQGVTWQGMAWMSTPSSPPPPHLPLWIKNLNVFWGFYGHTREEYRGKGLLKLALQILIKRSIEEGNTFFNDMSIDNIPPRRASLAVGLKPKGVLVTYHLGVPRIERKLILGRWYKEEEHPPII